MRGWHDFREKARKNWHDFKEEANEGWHDFGSIFRANIRFCLKMCSFGLYICTMMLFASHEPYRRWKLSKYFSETNCLFKR